MSISLDNVLSLMERYRLTPEEVLVIELLFLASSQERHKEFLIRYVNLSERSDLLSTLESLKGKGIILKSCKLPKKGDNFDPETITFNEVFLHNYRKYSGELASELLAEYPSIGYINGKEYSLNNFAKKFDDIDSFAFKYGKSIGWNLQKHQRVIELIKWGKENKSNLLTVGIGDFVISNLWNNLEKQKNGDGIMYFDNTVDI
jgi:hypothetical protein